MLPFPQLQYCRRAWFGNRSASNHNQHEVGVVKLLVLSFSASRYGEPTTFGQFIKKAGLGKGLKQVEVARVEGVDEMTLVNWGRYSTLPTPQPLTKRSRRVGICGSMPWIIEKPCWTSTFN